MKRLSPRRAGELRADALAREKYIGIIQGLQSEIEMYRNALTVISNSSAASYETVRRVAEGALKRVKNK